MCDSEQLSFTQLVPVFLSSFLSSLDQMCPGVRIFRKIFVKFPLCGRITRRTLPPPQMLHWMGPCRVSHSPFCRRNGKQVTSCELFGIHLYVIPTGLVLSDCRKLVSSAGRRVRRSYNTVEFRFFEPPREMEIGSKNREFEKSKVASKSHLFYRGIVLYDPRRQTATSVYHSC